jgi:hypothetical protein
MGVSHRTVALWVKRAARKRLDRVDFCSRPTGCRRAPNRTATRTERRVVSLRRQLKEKSDLGEFGAAAIRQALSSSGLRSIPSIRTIGRILSRSGMLDGRVRVRRVPPPRGWHLPEVAAGDEELDSFDIVEGLCIHPASGVLDVNVLNVISLHGHLPGSWPQARLTAKSTVDCLLEHWRRFGLPAYVQFDNDRIFAGAPNSPDVLGRVTRVCLSLGVTPVFVPPRETGFQAMIESYNGRWQSKVFARFEGSSLSGLKNKSDRFLQAWRGRHAAQADAAPRRRPFPVKWKLNLQSKPHGRITFLRRTNERGQSNILGHTFDIDADWVHRLVRAEVDLHRGRIQCFALRRRDPAAQPMLRNIAYEFPNRPFHE